MCVCICVCVALVIQHAMRTRHIVICGLPALQYISTLSPKMYDFRKKNCHGTKKYVLIFSTVFV